jgi:hypothetical protein
MWVVVAAAVLTLQPAAAGAVAAISAAAAADLQAAAAAPLSVEQREQAAVRGRLLPAGTVKTILPHPARVGQVFPEDPEGLRLGMQAAAVAASAAAAAAAMTTVAPAVAMAVQAVALAAVWPVAAQAAQAVVMAAAAQAALQDPAAVVDPLSSGIMRHPAPGKKWRRHTIQIKTAAPKTVIARSIATKRSTTIVTALRHGLPSPLSAVRNDGSDRWE